MKKQFGPAVVFSINRDVVINKQEYYIDITIVLDPNTYGENLYQPTIKRKDNADVSRCQAVYYRGTGEVKGKQWKLKVYDPQDKLMKTINNIPQDVPSWRLADRLGEVVPFYHEKV